MNLENIIVCGRSQTTRRGKSIETESRLAVAKGCGLGRGREKMRNDCLENMGFPLG